MSKKIFFHNLRHLSKQHKKTQAHLQQTQDFPSNVHANAETKSHERNITTESMSMCNVFPIREQKPIDMKCETKDHDGDVEMEDAPADVPARSKSLADLPTELQLQVYDYIKDLPGTLASLAVTCKGTQEAAMHVLYDNIMVNNNALYHATKARSTFEDFAESQVGRSLKSLIVDRTRKHKDQGLICRTLKTLEFSHDSDFFENAIDTDHAKQAIDKAIRQPPVEFTRHGNNRGTDQMKAALIASFEGLRSLCLDVYEYGVLFLLVGKALLNMGYDEVERTRLLSQDLDDADATALANALMPDGKVSDLAPLSLKGVLDRTLASHFSQLQSLEIRSALAVCLTAEGDETNPPGTISINGSWPQFKNLHTFKFHGHQVPDEVRSMFLSGSIPTNITLNGWPCKGTHNVFSRYFDHKRDTMRDTVISFTWRNMDPCIGVLDEMLRFLHESQRGSLESLSMVRPRREKDFRRTHERFHTGSMTLQEFSKLEYIDIDSRFLIRTNSLGDVCLKDWLNLPTNIQVLSIDAITKLETPYVKDYLKNLLEAIKVGMFPKLKDVRCAAIKMKGAEDFKAWMVLENMPGFFLAQKVSLAGWDYDVEENEQVDIIATRVRSRRRRRGAQ